MMKKIDLIQTNCILWPYAFDRVTVNRGSGGECFSIIGKCYSEYAGGPNLCLLADVAGELVGPGYYGLSSCRMLGYGK